MKILYDNRRAYADYVILDKLEAGIVLVGWEVKSIKAGSLSLTGAYIKEINNELVLIGSHIPIWKHTNKTGKEDEYRTRKLLVHKKQLNKLVDASKVNGITLIPLQVIQNDSGLIKVIIATARGKKKFDKRQTLKENDMKRRLDSDRKKYGF
jgi:SsrA-binding protein